MCVYVFVIAPFSYLSNPLISSKSILCCFSNCANFGQPKTANVKGGVDGGVCVFVFYSLKF